MSLREGYTLTDRELIALGGLLHDIGKFLQRATKETGSSSHSKEKKYFEYAHAELSYKESERILKILKLEEKREKVLSACFHHKPDTEYENINKDLFWLRALFRLADWYASTERSKLTDIESEEKYKRLRPVFESVKIDGFSCSEESIIKLSPLTLDEDVVLPKSLKEAQDYARDRGSELYEDYYGEYSKLWEDFNSALKSFRNKRLNSLSHKLSYFYHLFYRYAWCIPASIYDRERYHSHYPDISLFDHSRVVSAIATSLYTESNIKILKDYRDSEREKFADHLKLVIFEGDISGIQKFLYDISNIKGVSKRLRGRSTFLTFLPEVIGRFLLRKLRYPWTNLLYAGGGKFQAIVGYEEGIIDKLEKLSEEVEKSLIKAFGGKLGFVIYYTTLKLSDLKNYSDVIKNLMTEGEKAKKKKFIKNLKDFEKLANIENTEPAKLCPSCRWEPVPESAEEERVCKWCELFEKVGGKIPKSKYVAFSSHKIGELKDRGFFIEGIGGVYFLEDKDVRDLGKFDDVFIINKAEEFEADRYSTGFKFLAQSVPFEDENTEEIKSFEDLAKYAEGDKKIAYAKADVDNLGLIFMKGLGKNYTISRVATLSRSLDLFFSGYLNTLFDKEFKNQIYTVYAGGDDLFIVAPWNAAIEAIRRVREEFEYFTCKNRAFGLSCGIYIAAGNYPIRLAAEGVDRAESEAKKAEGKDSINVLGETLKWSELSDISELLQQAISKLESREVGRTNMYRIYMLLKEYFEEKDNDKRYMFYPFFYYYLIRNIKNSDDRKLIESLFLEVEKDYKVKKSALFCAKYILMRTRDVRT